MSLEAHLEGLYPFLHGKKQDPEAMNSALVESVRQKASHHQEVIDAFFAKNGQAVVDAAGALAEVYRRDGRLYSMGNGGSSCDAAHVAESWQLVHFIRRLPMLSERELEEMRQMNPRAPAEIRQEIEEERFLRGES